MSFNLAVTLLSLLLLTGCTANLNPLDISENDAAYLRNRIIKEDGATTGLPFILVNGEKFSPGFISAAQDVVYTIPSGGCTLTYRIVYKPGFIAARWYQRHATLHINAKPGYTYQANAIINEMENRIVTWIEDMDGNRVSQLASGELGLSVQEEFYEKLPNLIPDKQNASE